MLSADKVIEFQQAPKFYISQGENMPALKPPLLASELVKVMIALVAKMRATSRCVVLQVGRQLSVLVAPP